ncbi:hypothetical protein NMG60_11030941 [Bertholletia excelsa]
MGKLICHSPTSSLPWRDPTSAPSVDDCIPTVDLADPTTIAGIAGWKRVSGPEDQQRRHLQRPHDKGVLWRCVGDDGSSSAVGIGARELRRRTVRRFLEDFRYVSREGRQAIDSAISHMYSPDLKSGWGADKEDRKGLDSAIHELVHLGMQKELATESICKKRCIPANDGQSWAKYMSICGSSNDEHDIITLHHTEEGLLTVGENRESHAAAFGDDIAIKCLATEFQREIYVNFHLKVQAHGSDAMVDEQNCVLFLPRLRSQIGEPPFFLFMKGTGWCGAGGDHYEPLIAHPFSIVSQEKVALVV